MNRISSLVSRLTNVETSLHSLNRSNRKLLDQIDIDTQQQEFAIPLQHHHDPTKIVNAFRKHDIDPLQETRYINRMEKRYGLHRPRHVWHANDPKSEQDRRVAFVQSHIEKRLDTKRSDRRKAGLPDVFSRTRPRTAQEIQRRPLSSLVTPVKKEWKSSNVSLNQSLRSSFKLHGASLRSPHSAVSRADMHSSTGRRNFDAIRPGTSEHNHHRSSNSRSDDTGNSRTENGDIFEHRKRSGRREGGITFYPSFSTLEPNLSQSLSTNEQFGSSSFHMPCTNDDDTTDDDVHQIFSRSEADGFVVIADSTIEDITNFVHSKREETPKIEYWAEMVTDRRNIANCDAKEIDQNFADPHPTKEPENEANQPQHNATPPTYTSAPETGSSHTETDEENEEVKDSPSDERIPEGIATPAPKPTQNCDSNPVPSLKSDPISSFDDGTDRTVSPPVEESSDDENTQTTEPEQDGTNMFLISSILKDIPSGESTPSSNTVRGSARERGLVPKLILGGEADEEEKGKEEDWRIEGIDEESGKRSENRKGEKRRENLKKEGKKKGKAKKERTDNPNRKSKTRNKTKQSTKRIKLEQNEDPQVTPTADKAKTNTPIVSSNQANADIQMDVVSKSGTISFEGAKEEPTPATNTTPPPIAESIHPLISESQVQTTTPVVPHQNERVHIHSTELQPQQHSELDTDEQRETHVRRLDLTKLSRYQRSVHSSSSRPPTLDGSVGSGIGEEGESLGGTQLASTEGLPLRNRLMVFRKHHNTLIREREKQKEDKIRKRKFFGIQNGRNGKGHVSWRRTDDEEADVGRTTRRMIDGKEESWTDRELRLLQTAQRPKSVGSEGRRFGVGCLTRNTNKQREDERRKREARERRERREATARNGQTVPTPIISIRPLSASLRRAQIDHTELSPTERRQQWEEKRKERQEKLVFSPTRRTRTPKIEDGKVSETGKTNEDPVDGISEQIGTLAVTMSGEGDNREGSELVLSTAAGSEVEVKHEKEGEQEHIPPSLLVPETENQPLEIPSLDLGLDLQKEQQGE
ncbi:hypothetical protein BLNAU_7404 [Blattamonas nauphoetae]|uniref:Uncharacterized protein n=1 Tax=Blattamonas nauphoetae TaxID=2049346 RepID=A0ABQ9Y197_9EUKA|nr:hypothetical protein BLNAU_7404 [Blattamonas nauphoetae]